MHATAEARRRALFTGFAACAGLVAFALSAVTPTLPSAIPSANAAPDPCAASEIAKTVGSVATSTGSYLDSHPQTNQALTAISRRPAGPQSMVALKTYLDANPQVSKDMQQLQQPLVGLSTTCKLPITMPQLLALMQQAQQQGTAAQAVSAPSVALPAQPSPASAVTTGAGPLPAPVSTR